MQSVLVTFKFYARGTSLHNKVLTLDSSKTWGEELKYYFPDGKNNYFVRRLAKREQHNFGEKISILMNEYHQVRTLFVVEILKNGRKRKYRKKLRKTGRKSKAAENDDYSDSDSDSSSSISTTVWAPENGRKMTDRSLRNEKKIFFPEDDYSLKIKQNFDTESICTVMSQGSQEELDFQGIPNLEIKPRVLHKSMVLSNARFLAVENEVMKLKRNDPNRWAKAGNILPISLTFLDLIFLGDE